MAAPVQLTPGGVPLVSNHVAGAETVQAVLQVLDVRAVVHKSNDNPGGSNRYRMLLSDGVYSLQSMLATAENHHIRDGYIQKGSIIHLQEYTCSTIKTRRITIVLKLDVLQTECEIIGSPKPYELVNPPTEQAPNLPANAAQVNSGAFSSGPGMLGSSVAPRVAQVANNVSQGGSYGGHPGMVNPPIGRAVDPVPNVSSGGSYGSYGTASAHNTMNADMVQSNLQQPSLNSHQNQRFAVPAMAGGSGAPVNTMNVDMVQSNLQQPSLNSHQNQRFAVPAMAGGSSAPVNAMNADMVQSNLQQPSLNSHQNQRFAVPSMAGGSSAPVNTYGRPAQPFYQQPPPGHMNRGPVTKNEATRAIPVAQLNPYQERWTIKARVTSKTDLKHFKNDKGPGKVFSFHLLDAQGGEIRATCFNVQADQFFDLIEVDKVYLISRGSLKPAQKKFNPLNHEYEITLDFKTSIEVCPNDDSSIPRQQYNFHQISEIENIEVNSIVDLVGIVTSVCPSATLTRKDGSETQKRTLQLKDMSGRSVEVTLWGKFCDAEGQKLQSLCDSGLNPVLALKSVRVTEFNGRSVSTISSTQLKIDPDFPEADKLQHWYATEGKTAACVSLSAASSMGKTDIRKTVVQIKDENLGRSEKPDWITVKGAISHVNTDSFCYPACTWELNGRQCNKKVINNGDGTWFCEKCDQRLEKCEYRYLLQCQIQDHTGLTYANAFHEPGLEILGYSAEELYNIKEEDAERFAEIIQGVRWQQFLFKLKVYEETFNDEQRIKCQITKAEKLDLSRECSYLLKAIGALLQDDTGSPSEVQGASMAYNAGLNNSGTRQSVPASNSPHATSMPTPKYGESANQFGQQAHPYGGMSAPFSATRNVQTCMSCGSSGHNAQNCPSGIYRPQQQQPAANTASSYGSSPGDVGSGLCYKCNQPGHFARNCPGVGAAHQQQPYGSGVASGAYGRPPHGRATNY